MIMKLVCNRFELFNAMINRKQMVLNLGGINRNCYINSIEMEDGSGHCFNVGIYLPNRKSGEHMTIFVRSE